MKFYDVYEVNTNGTLGRLLMSATDEQLEEFKKGREWAKFYNTEHNESRGSLEGFDFYTISYEAKIIYAVEELRTYELGIGYGARYVDEWTEIATYKTRTAANKRINNELKFYVNNIERYEEERKRLRIVERYQTIHEI